MTATTPASASPAHVTLWDVRWSTYEALLADRGDSGPRMAYDEGVLEIMSPSGKHERAKKLIARLIEAYTEELGIEIESGGALTLKREVLKKGIEPDECYYVASAEAIRGVDDVDLERDPPPDLVIEVDVSRSSVSKRRIYAAFGVPEVWRHTAGRIEVHRLSAGSYGLAEASEVFPGLPLDEVARFVAMRGTLGETTIIRRFRAFVREHLTS